MKKRKHWDRCNEYIWIYFRKYGSLINDKGFTKRYWKKWRRLNEKKEIKREVKGLKNEQRTDR